MDELGSLGADIETWSHRRTPALYPSAPAYDDSLAHPLKPSLSCSQHGSRAGAIG
jgi:hypothetical protein